MNTLPKKFIRVMPDKLQPFVIEVFERVGTSAEGAEFLADLLVRTDLRGVFSHGTCQLPGYIEKIRDGHVNPCPNVSVVDDSVSTAVVDGDGGLGHFAAYRAACIAVEKAKSIGLGAAVSRNHFHIGSAGKYSRLALESECVGFVVSAHRVRHAPESSILNASQASPMSFAIPSGREAPIVVDMANSISSDEPIESLFPRIPATFFKNLGLGMVCHALGGFMAGIWLFDNPGDSSIWEASDQGAFVMAIDVSRFIPATDFKRDIDQYLRALHETQPAPGYDRATLPGELEFEREREWRKYGIPIGTKHQDALSLVANRLGIPVPF